MKIIVVISLLFWSCQCFGQLTKIAAVNEVKAWLTENAEGLHANIENSKIGFEILCPLGVKCDENYDYRSFTYRNENQRMTLSFEPDLALGISLEKLNSMFKYLDPGSVELPQLDGWYLVSYSMLSPIRTGVKFTAYEKGIVSFETSFIYKGFTLEDHSSALCKEAYAMEDSAIPESCMVQFDENLKVQLSVKLPIQDERVLDRSNGR